VIKLQPTKMSTQDPSGAAAAFLNGVGVLIPNPNIDIPVERVLEELSRDKELRLNVLRVLAGAMMVRRVPVDEVKLKIEYINNSITQAAQRRSSS
jgi:hypothetical protein